MNWLTQVTKAPSFTKIAVSSTLDAYAFHRWDAPGVCSVCFFVLPARGGSGDDAEEMLGPRSPGHAEEVSAGTFIASLYILF